MSKRVLFSADTVHDPESATNTAHQNAHPRPPQRHDRSVATYTAIPAPASPTHSGKGTLHWMRQEMFETYEKDGAEAMFALYGTLHEQFYGRGSYDFGQGALNQFGYEFLSKGGVKTAIEIFKLNVEMYPESGNAYDSLAEAYMANEQNDLAIEFYEKALEKNPDNEGAREKLEQLRDAEN